MYHVISIDLITMKNLLSGVNELTFGKWDGYYQVHTAVGLINVLSFNKCRLTSCCVLDIVLWFWDPWIIS